MSILNEQVKQQLSERFAEQLSGPVQLTLYTRPGTGRLILPSGMGCATCDDARQLAEDVQSASPDSTTTGPDSPAITDVSSVLTTASIAISPAQIRHPRYCLVSP